MPVSNKWMLLNMITKHLLDVQSDLQNIQGELIDAMKLEEAEDVDVNRGDPIV